MFLLYSGNARIVFFALTRENFVMVLLIVLMVLMKSNVISVTKKDISSAKVFQDFVFLIKECVMEWEIVQICGMRRWRTVGLAIKLVFFFVMMALDVCQKKFFVMVKHSVLISLMKRQDIALVKQT